MQDDPIVEEVHESRRRLLEECGGDLEALMDRLKKRETEEGVRIRRWSREEFERLTADGFFRPSERVELVDGIICSIGMRGLLFDLDGTVYQEGEAIPGAAETLDELRRRGIPFRFTTNTTRRPRSALAERLRAMGIAASPEEILSAPSAAARWLRDRGVRRVQLLFAEATFEEFSGFEIVDHAPEVVVVGDLGEGWTFPLLNQAFRNLLDGAELLAIQRNRYWQTEGGLSLDAGPFVAALEYGSGKTATLAGKPSPVFFEMAARELNLPPERIAVVGDDLESDVAGARAAGMIGVAVRTGKFRPQDEERAQWEADVVLDSIAAVLSLI